MECENMDKYTQDPLKCQPYSCVCLRHAVPWNGGQTAHASIRCFKPSLGPSPANQPCAVFLQPDGGSFLPLQAVPRADPKRSMVPFRILQTLVKSNLSATKRCFVRLQIACSEKWKFPES